MNGAIRRKPLAHLPQHLDCEPGLQFALAHVAANKQGMERTFTLAQSVGEVRVGVGQLDRIDADQRRPDRQHVAMAWQAVIGRQHDEVEIRDAPLGRVEQRDARGAARLLLDPQRDTGQVPADGYHHLGPRSAQLVGMFEVDTAETWLNGGFARQVTLLQCDMPDLEGQAGGLRRLQHLRIVARFRSCQYPDIGQVHFPETAQGQ